MKSDKWKQPQPFQEPLSLPGMICTHFIFKKDITPGLDMLIGLSWQEAKQDACRHTVIAAKLVQRAQNRVHDNAAQTLSKINPNIHWQIPHLLASVPPLLLPRNLALLPDHLLHNHKALPRRIDQLCVPLGRPDQDLVLRLVAGQGRPSLVCEIVQLHSEISRAGRDQVRLPRVQLRLDRRRHHLNHPGLDRRRRRRRVAALVLPLLLQLRPQRPGERVQRRLGRAVVAAARHGHQRQSRRDEHHGRRLAPGAERGQVRQEVDDGVHGRKVVEVHLARDGLGQSRAVGAGLGQRCEVGGVLNPCVGHDAVQRGVFACHSWRGGVSLRQAIVRAVPDQG